MRAAVVSDIHGSLTPLEAIIRDLEDRSPDAVVLGGDLALLGPQPAEVVDRLRELGWPGVVGNTDEMLWRPELRAERLERAPCLRALTAEMFDRYAPFTSERLGEDRLRGVRETPAAPRGECHPVMHPR